MTQELRSMKREFGHSYRKDTWPSNNSKTHNILAQIQWSTHRVSQEGNEQTRYPFLLH